MNDIRVIGGNFMYLRYAYIEKANPTRFGRFGLLEAACMQDAKRWLGKGVRVKKTWLNQDEHDNTSNKDRVWEVVSSVFGVSRSD